MKWKMEFVSPPPAPPMNMGGLRFVLFFSLFLLFVPLLLRNDILFAQSNTTIEQIQRAYQSNTLRQGDTMLDIESSDSSPVRAAKSYYKAIMQSDVQELLLLHTNNFSSFPNEHYGKMSGIQLVTIDFVNHEHEKALAKLSQIGDSIPEALYWKAKITQLNQGYDEAITICQSFIRQFQSNPLVPYIWLILLESYFYKADLAGFERNLRTFSSYASFDEYKPYLFYLNGRMIEHNNLARSRTIYSQVINEFPLSQFRVQAEDRLFALRTGAERPVSPISPPLTPRVDPPPPIVTPSVTFTNTVVSRYEDLEKDKFYIQFGVFSTENAANNLVTSLNNERISTFHITKPVSGRRLFAVVQGPYPSMAEAQTNQRIYSAGHQTFIFRAE